MPERNFKGIWIPATIWLNQSLSAIDKVLLAEIDSFTGNGKTYRRSLEGTAAFLGVSKSTAQRSLSHLLDLKLIREAANNGRFKSYVTCQSSQNDHAESSQNDHQTNSEETNPISAKPKQKPKESVKVDTHAFTDLWREFAGPTAILNGEDYKHAKELLLEHSLADLRPLIAHYFKHDWWFTKDGKDFDSFYRHIGKVAANLRPGTLHLVERWHLECPVCHWRSAAELKKDWCPECGTAAIPADGRPNLVKVSGL